MLQDVNVKNYRFEAPDGRIFDTSDQTLEGLILELWLEQVEATPYQLVECEDGQIVLRFAHELPKELARQLPGSARLDDAVAFAVLARLEDEAWKIIWVAPIVAEEGLLPEEEGVEIWIWDERVTTELMRKIA